MKQALKDKISLITRLVSNPIRSWTLKEVSELIGVSVATLYREIKKGKLTVYKIGGSPRVSHEELVRYNQGNDPVKDALAQLQILISLQELLSLNSLPPPLVTSLDPPVLTQC